MENGKKLMGLTSDDVETIIRDHYNEIFKYCFWRVHEYADAEDLTQETFMKFIEYLPQYHDQGKPKALLYTLARNLCINWNKKSKSIPLTNFMESTANCEMTDETEGILNRLDMHNYMNELPEELQEVLLLRYFEELKVSEIAKVLSISRFSVMYRIRIAKNELKIKMRDGQNEQ